jgi:lipopolysaccharide transport protein LptA
VVLKIASETGPPTDVRADRATGSREEHELKFEGHVRVVQGSDSLVAGRLDIDLNDELTAAYRAVAVEDVELKTSGDAPLPGATGTGKAKGPRVLKARKLDLWFREDKTLKEATASPDADLLVLPGPGEAQEKRRVQAKVLAFRFDEQGRLQELQAQRDALVSAEPLRAGKGAAAPRTVAAGNLVAVLDPATGETQQVRFQDGVEFRQGGKVGRGQVARYEGGRGVLVLSGEPELRDEVEGTELRAKTIEIANASGDVKAEDGVRQTRRAKPAGKGGFLSGDEATTVIVADRLEYEAQGRRARYTGKALLRSGKDEVRGQTLVLEEPTPERRRLTATGDVVSRLSPRAAEGKKPAAAVEGRAGEMVYEAARGEIVYTGGVTMRQGDIQTKSPRAVLTLTEDGRDLLTLVAGEPAEIEQGKRRAKGARATYTPATETVVIVGDKVVLEDPGQQVEGRSLTFRVGDEAILVDGQEQVRTEAVIRRDPRQP